MQDRPSAVVQNQPSKTTQIFGLSQAEAVILSYRYLGSTVRSPTFQGSNQNQDHFTSFQVFVDSCIAIRKPSAFDCCSQRRREPLLAVLVSSRTFMSASNA